MSKHRLACLCDILFLPPVRKRITVSCNRLRNLLPAFDGRQNDMASILEMTVEYLQRAQDHLPKQQQSSVGSYLGFPVPVGGATLQPILARPPLVASGPSPVSAPTHLWLLPHSTGWLRFMSLCIEAGEGKGAPLCPVSFASYLCVGTGKHTRLDCTCISGMVHAGFQVAVSPPASSGALPLIAVFSPFSQSPRLPASAEQPSGPNETLPPASATQPIQGGGVSESSQNTPIPIRLTHICLCGSVPNSLRVCVWSSLRGGGSQRRDACGNSRFDARNLQVRLRKDLWVPHRSIRHR